MNRRTTLAKLFGRTGKSSAGVLSAPPVVTSGLDPYTGSWDFEQAAHLLRRTTFGPTLSEINTSVQNGMEATVNTLFAAQSLPDPPVNFSFEDDPAVPIGETWIDAPYPADPALRGPIRGYRSNSLRNWSVDIMLREGTSLREKMVLFWHNHFVTSIENVSDPRFMYRYINLFRTDPWGNFRELTKQITVDPAMLQYLNGHQNSEMAPNENYARELLELFTIGKGPLADEGDYTNYTELDVVQMARVLTGWRASGYFSSDPDVEVGSFFVPFRHDDGDKQLSHRFDEVTISNMGEDEYSFLIDLIFTKDEVARFISRKLYRWFIYYEITPEAEANVIEPLAQLIVDNDYDLQPALEVFFSSEHFYDMLSIGPMIKNPVDFAVGAVRQLEIELPPMANFFQVYRVAFQISRTTAPMQMELFAPPSVAGWPAYYQEPSFYRLWINSVTLPLRMEIHSILAGPGFMTAGWEMKFNPLTFIEQFSDPFDPNALIHEFAQIFFPQPITQTQVDFLKEILIPGLPDFEWTVEYGDYVNNPDDPDLSAAVDNKLRSLVTAMLSMPEAFLS